jgi:hypothetical protein
MSFPLGPIAHWWIQKQLVLLHWRVDPTLVFLGSSCIRRLAMSGPPLVGIAHQLKLVEHVVVLCDREYLNALLMLTALRLAGPQNTIALCYM